MSIELWLQICLLLIPITLLIGGICFVRHIPKEINSIVGYRTPRSTKNKDTWKFAHEYCGKLWTKLGLILLILTVIAIIILRNYDINTISKFEGIIVWIQMAVMFVSIFLTERALKKEFDNKGNRRKC